MENSALVNDYKVAVTEVLDILGHLPKGIVSKVPIKFREFLKNNSIPNYKPNFDYSKGIDNIPLKNKTKALLAVVYRDYICSEEERKKYNEILYKNEKMHQDEIREKYNVQNIFKEKEQNKEVQLVEYKKTKWYQKILKKIFKFF